jgi:Asp-tRNA(Asn)/Glu-tRNA(Gln) amidotransferase A subunit family amidase
MTDVTANATEIVAAVRAGTISAASVVARTVERIERLDTGLNAFTHLDVERARAAASRIDRLIEEGRDPGPLAGATFAVKNLFDIEGVVTLAGSKINASRPAAAADSKFITKIT